MKVFQLSSFDEKGGAAIAAMRLQQGLVAENVNSEMLVQFKSGKARLVYGPIGKLQKGMALVNDTLEYLPLLPYQNKLQTVFSANFFSSNIASRVNDNKVDMVNLHWVHAGMLSPTTLKKFNAPIVWTLHDMWAFTGGCHYSSACDAYEEHCGKCPQLGSSKAYDLSRFIHNRKQKAWTNLSIFPVSPSQWLADCASKSSLFAEREIRVIPNGLDLTVWRPIEQDFARNILNLPDGPLVMFTAAQGLAAPYKGGLALLDVLQNLYINHFHFTLVLMGDTDLPEDIKVSFPVQCLGQLNDDVSKVLAFSAVDVTLHNAYQDNLPNTIAESLACATPVIANAVGGVSEMIDDKENGFLVPLGDAIGFSKALMHFFSLADRKSMKSAARIKAEKSFDLSKMATAYSHLYEEYLEKSRFK